LGITATLLTQVNILGGIIIFIQAALVLTIIALLESVAKRGRGMRDSRRSRSVRTSL